MNRHLDALREAVSRFVKDNGYGPKIAAEKLGISRTALIGLLRGDRKDVYLSTLWVISESTGIPIPELIGFGKEGA